MIRVRQVVGLITSRRLYRLKEHGEHTSEGPGPPPPPEEAEVAEHQERRATGVLVLHPPFLERTQPMVVEVVEETPPHHLVLLVVKVAVVKVRSHITLITV